MASSANVIALAVHSELDSPTMLKEFAVPELPVAQCHASTIARTPIGLAVAFFGGSKEGANDVGIWLTLQAGGKWQPPRQIATGACDGMRHPCWNPVLYQASGGELLLFYKVGANCDDWWGMLMRSGDHGVTWSSPERLPEGILGPIKNKPILHRGQLICPSSTERRGWRAHLEITSDLGRTWRTVGPLNDGTTIAAIQPSVLARHDGALQLLCRTRQGRIAECWSHDGGRTWNEMSLTDLPNPNSGTDALVLQDGRSVLVYNPTGVPDGRWGGERTPLCIALSDDGRRWRRSVTLEDAPGEYSYPAIIQDETGFIHITYTWRRENIRYGCLSPSELE